MADGCYMPFIPELVGAGSPHLPHIGQAKGRAKRGQGP
jgi:hypothetical protein